MKKLVLAIPTLYGDHHTVAVRGILAALPGISDLYVSSAQRMVSLRYDPQKTDPEAIEKALAEHGYEVGGPEPTYVASLASEFEKSARYTSFISGTGDTLTFAEHTQVHAGRPLWPCPGFDVRSRHPVE